MFTIAVLDLSFFVIIATVLTALGEAQAKLGVLEQELGRAQRTIQKSKKASEVQVRVEGGEWSSQRTQHNYASFLCPKAVTQEKDVLKRKLQSQEEEFRLQNQTLLTELSNVSITLHLTPSA